jgi:hypothetical protein
MIEQIMRDYERAYNLQYVSLRYFIAAGADPDGEIGEDHDPETHLIPLAIQAALGGRPYLEILPGTVRRFETISMCPTSRWSTLSHWNTCLAERRVSS